LGFDYPNPQSLAAYLRHQLVGDAEPVAAPVVIEPATPQEPEVMEEDPVVVVAMACRYPGGVRDPDDLWALVADGRDAVSEFPNDRGWDLERLYDPEGRRPHSSVTREGGFIDDAGAFDAGLFGIGPREALAMDPQQRQLLEVVWEAFERASIDPSDLRGSKTGVFAGVATHDYVDVLHGNDDLEGYIATGTTGSVASGRIAYVFGLQGPALTVDTACSSSLVSVHLARRALLSGECSMAVAAGVTVVVTPKVYTEFSRQGGLSPDGRCRAYAASANGTGFSEGVGVLLLARESEARRNGYPILAAVKGSAVNQDGASNGLTAPSGLSQERLIRDALVDAGLSAKDVDAVEGHGTGTTLGDPIEAQALLATYGQDRTPGRPLHLGSIKSNIGHTQAAAGMAGMIKMILSMRHGVLARTLHVDEPSPRMDWTAGDVSLLTEQMPWPAVDRPRRAGVSAFGMSGTNAHVIIEERPASKTEGQLDAPNTVDQSAEYQKDAGLRAWLLSARSDSALAAQANRLADHVKKHPELSSADVAHSLHTRVRHEVRAVAIGANRSELLPSLANIANDDLVDGERTATGRAFEVGKVGFMFGGQGSQWVGMGRALMGTSKTFRASVNRCAEAFSPYIDWSLTKALEGAPNAPSFDRVDVVQPAIFTMMVALADLWRSFGVTADVVTGHSQGEIAAACVAGALSLEDAARIAALRSRALVAISKKGGMVSVALPVEEVERRIAAWGARLSLAVVHGPSTVVVSGDNDALTELLAGCKADQVWARKIPVDYASHSHHVDALHAELERVLAPVSPQATDIAYVSGTTGERLQTSELIGAYWFENLRRPVRGDLALRTMVDLGCRAFVEPSAHPVLTVGVEAQLEAMMSADAKRV
ncbi:MAG: type I polyketide synthase, partial [Myxococcota bacterium]